MSYESEPETARLWREPDPTRHDLEAYRPPAAPPPVYQQVQPYQPYPPPRPYARPLKSTGAAVLLELGLGLFGLFGVGALYAERTGLGMTLMVSYWILFWINVGLAFLVIGLFTGPLTWLIYMIVSPVLSARAVDQHNAY